MAEAPSPTPDESRPFAARFGGRFKLSLALGIVIVSILAAIMAWQSSVWGERSGNTDELTRQDQVELERILTEQDGAINQDIRVFNNFEEASLLAQELDRDAKKLKGQQALDLMLEAGSQRAEAKSQRRFFRSSDPTVDANGDVRYDAAFTERLLRAYSPELEVLRPDELREDARVAGVKSVRLTGLAALLVAALLFLTLAEVLTRRSMTRVFAGAGAATAVIAVGLYLFAI